MSAKILKVIARAAETHSPEVLVFDDVDLKDFAVVQERLRGQFSQWEGYSLRIHWLRRERVLKIVMPSKLHESVGAWISSVLTQAAMLGQIPAAWVRTMQVMNAPGYNNFLGEYAGYVKEADVTFVPLLGPTWTEPAQFPSVVLETGWSESCSRLCEDARLWQVGSQMAVRVVLLGKFYPKDLNNRVRFVLSIFRGYPDARTNLSEFYEILPPPREPDENPTISFEEFYAGNCPPDVDPDAFVTLDLGLLRTFASIWIRERGCIPA